MLLKQFLKKMQFKAVFFLVICAFSVSSYATETAIWEESSSSVELIDHSKWQSFLKKFIQAEKLETENSAINYFRYSAVSKEERKELSSYLTYLQSIDPRDYNSDEQFAYWANLYNALTVDLILENYPLKSITKLGSLLSFGPWDKEATEVAGETLTLNDIEHKILRPIWKDPRIHYAVNCASYGCPNLSDQAFTAENKEALLDQGARAYVNHSRGVSFKGKRLTLSKIYKWYVEDFGSSEAGVLEHIIQYAEPELAKRIKEYDGKVKYEYDWSLNEAK